MSKPTPATNSEEGKAKPRMFDVSLGRFLTPEEQEQSMQEYEALVESFEESKQLVLSIPGLSIQQRQKMIRSFDEAKRGTKRFLAFGGGEGKD